MSPTAPMLAQSESKVMFFSRLGLDERNKTHRHIYSQMKEEAAGGWKRMTATRESLASQYKNDLSIQAPYTFNQIDERVIQLEILAIHRRARSQTRLIYDLGRDFYDGHEENWIIRWLLWHVFRYRDDRNSTSRRMARSCAGSGSPSSLSSFSSSSYDRGASVESTTVAEALSNSSPRTALSSSHSVCSSGRSRESSNEASSRFWDPVRGCYRT
ncbi:unnamed protein product [Zymoseptoria tritici ST99CH_1A5]|uniref:Uncharacterized protein n=4 Tax=Zymoseptoria tritici TaxID=1047171 RepID=A0A1X7RV28_ZYMT9|nr:unnamed protein product [Zymoseptoria tritici ST99CH_3D7]SMR53223.1 unnamed protein product [Zymoseptoria tritici ST99CH_1E4]SMR54890.1 unnamed protein product [Zymoseptoria tritici ST99CH_3D1]SMY24963.1 unnamed protein product [Zymoseptoria tritici ST99CH_1A5]